MNEKLKEIIDNLSQDEMFDLIRYIDDTNHDVVLINYINRNYIQEVVNDNELKIEVDDWVVDEVKDYLYSLDCLYDSIYESILDSLYKIKSKWKQHSRDKKLNNILCQTGAKTQSQ